MRPTDFGDITLRRPETLLPHPRVEEELRDVGGLLRQVKPGSVTHGRCTRTRPGNDTRSSPRRTPAGRVRTDPVKPSPPAASERRWPGFSPGLADPFLDLRQNSSTIIDRVTRGGTSPAASSSATSRAAVWEHPANSAAARSEPVQSHGQADFKWSLLVGTAHQHRQADSRRDAAGINGGVSPNPHR